MATPELTQQIRRVEPSSLLWRPCGLLLNDGRRLDRVHCVEEEHGLYNNDWIPLTAIAEVYESPFRLPAEFVQRIYDVGYIKEDCSIFSLQFADGFDAAYVTNGPVDFLDYPPGHNVIDVVGVTPIAGPFEQESCYHEAALDGVCYFVSSVRCACGAIVAVGRWRAANAPRCKSCGARPVIPWLAN